MFCPAFSASGLRGPQVRAPHARLLPARHGGELPRHAAHGREAADPDLRPGEGAGVRAVQGEVPEARGAQRRVLEFLSFVAREFLGQTP